MSRPPSHPRVIRKSIAYLTQIGRILFFRADEVPESGAELQCGRSNPGEDPLDGLRMEILGRRALPRSVRPTPWVSWSSIPAPS
jgi:hypothetical protein